MYLHTYIGYRYKPKKKKNTPAQKHRSHLPHPNPDHNQTPSSTVLKLHLQFFHLKKGKKKQLHGMDGSSDNPMVMQWQWQWQGLAKNESKKWLWD
jgi:hypothetical protein